MIGMTWTCRPYQLCSLYLSCSERYCLFLILMRIHKSIEEGKMEWNECELLTVKVEKGTIKMHSDSIVTLSSCYQGVIHLQY